MENKPVNKFIKDTRHVPQSSPVKILSERKHLRKKEKTYCHLRRLTKYASYE